jgi:hypothetical protein
MPEQLCYNYCDMHEQEVTYKLKYTHFSLSYEELKQPQNLAFAGLFQLNARVCHLSAIKLQWQVWLNAFW